MSLGAPASVPPLPASLLDWLRSVTESLPQDFTEARCRELAEPPPRDSYEPLEDVRRIVVHHSATPDGCVRLFRLLHRGLNGWIDVGYHYVIGNGTYSGDGEVEEGRPSWARGAHAKGGNADSLGICLVGNFEDSEPTAAQLGSLGRLLRGLVRLHRLKPEDVVLHRDVGTCRTACPGRNLDRAAVLARFQVEEA